MTPADPARSPIPWGWLALVVSLAVAISLAGLGNEFVQDDIVIVAQNPRMQSLADWWTLVTRPYWPPPWTEDHWRPITSLALDIQYHLGGGSPLPFRIISTCLYGFVSAGVFLLVRSFLPQPAAIGAALLFAVHPLHVEAVALGVGQAELIVALLAVATVGWYLRCRRRGDGWLRGRDWLVVAGLYLAAALTKEHGLMVPGLLLAAEASLLPGPLGPRIRRLWPGFAVLAGLGLLVIQLRTIVVGNLVGSYPAEALTGLGPGDRALTTLALVVEWLRLLAWPAHLKADYAPQELTASTAFGATEALGLLLVVLAALAAWRCRRRAPAITFGLLWSAVAIFPVSNLLVATSILVAERTLFLASVGAVITGGGVIDLAWQAGSEHTRTVRRTVVAVTGVVVILGAVRSVTRWSAWHDERSYVLQTVRDAPRSFRAQRAYGEVLFLSGQRAEGVAAYGRALQYVPPEEEWRVRNDLARRYFEEGASALAVEQLITSRERSPAVPETWNYLILGLLNLGEYPAAKREAEAALARGFSTEVFEDLRSLADTAMRANVPPGAIRINVVR